MVLQSLDIVLSIVDFSYLFCFNYKSEPIKLFLNFKDYFNKLSFIESKGIA
jgi:hypothetical protein